MPLELSSRGGEQLLSWCDCLFSQPEHTGPGLLCVNTHTHTHLLHPGSLLSELPGLASVWSLPAGVYHSRCFPLPCSSAKLVLIWAAGDFSEVTSAEREIYGGVCFHSVWRLPRELAAWLSEEEQNASQNKPPVLSLNICSWLNEKRKVSSFFPIWRLKWRVCLKTDCSKLWVYLNSMSTLFTHGKKNLKLIGFF